MVIGYHVVFSMYGFWLPNDPRGSGSVYVASKDLYQHGPATHVNSRRSVAGKPHDHQQRLAAKSALRRTPVEIHGEQALAIAKGFAKSADEDQIVFWACAILPRHVHLVLARHARPVEWVVTRLKRAGTIQLLAESKHPFQHLKADETSSPPAMWSRGHRKIFLNSACDVLRDIRYVEDNPVREGKKRQRWSFISPYIP